MNKEAKEYILNEEINKAKDIETPKIKANIRILRLKMFFIFRYL